MDEGNPRQNDRENNEKGFGVKRKGIEINYDKQKV